MADLEIIGLHVSADGKEILKGINLSINMGEVNAIMGPNGSGKSTLAYTLMGNPKCKVTKGKIIFMGKDITNMPADERARMGLFLSFQYPSEISGVTMSNFLRTALNSITGQKISVPEFHKIMREKMELLKVDPKFASRYLNEGFSGGEKKKAEILQMAVLKPKIAILDETDSGLDVDALKTVANGVNAVMQGMKGKMGVLVITHYQRLLNYIKPDRVHVLIGGRIVKSGDSSLALELEEKGYENIAEGV